MLTALATHHGNLKVSDALQTTTAEVEVARFPDQKRWRGALLLPIDPKVVVILLLCCVSLAAFNSSARYETDRSGILPNQSWDSGVSHWQRTRHGVDLIRTDSVPTVVLTFRGGQRFAVLSHRIADPRRFKHIWIRVEATLEDVLPGAEGWQQAGVMLRSFDRAGQRLWYWPYEVFASTGTSDWRRYDAVIPVGAEVAAMRLFLYHAGISGKLSLRALEIDAVSEAGWFKTTRLALIVLWCLAGAWVLVPLIFRRVRDLKGRVCLLLGIAILVAVLTPQPNLRDSANAVVALLKLPMERGGSSVQTSRSNEGSGVHKEAGESQERWTFPSPTIEPVDTEGSKAPGVIQNLDLGHLAAFAMLGFLAFFAFPNVPWPHLMLYLLVGALASEVLQVFSITRSAQVQDGVMNFLGIILGGVTHFLCRRFLRARAKT